MKRRIVLLGPPASGKGTLADALQVKLAIPVASVGAMLRAEKAAGTPLGLQADQLTREGQLIDDTIINGVVRSWLSHQKADGFIFDGYPRTLGQAESLDQVLNAAGAPVEIALLLEASFDTLRHRVESRVTCFQCGNIASLGRPAIEPLGNCPRCGGPWSRRNDDTAATLEHRFREYAEKTAPLAGYYEKRHLLHRLDTERPAEQVLESALNFLHLR